MTRTKFDQPWKLPHYFDVGADALRSIILALIQAQKEPPKTILDLPCGSGRVTRHLCSFFPKARVVASDLYDPHMKFCSDVFGVETMPSKERLNDIELPTQFDLIFCGSLLTHLPEDTFASALTFISRALSDRGVAIITLHGRHVEFAHKHKYGLIQDELFDLALSDIPARGFGYVDYHHNLLSTAWDRQQHYGITLSRPHWILEQMEADYNIRVIGYTERGWDCGQDVLAIAKPGVNAWMRHGDIADEELIQNWSGPSIPPKPATWRE